MSKKGNIFNLENQQHDVTAKIVVSLERISEAFRTLLWRHSNETGLSPIQIQLLIFIQNHPENLCKISYLSKEFNLAKPTISDAVKTLIKKEFLIKIGDSTDNRSFGLKLTKNGVKLVEQLAQFTSPLESIIGQLTSNQQEDLLEGLSTIVYKLKREGIILNQRTCFGCRYYSNQDNSQYCHLLKAPLKKSDIRLDCQEFEEKESA